MKKNFLSVLAGVGLASLILQLPSGAGAATSADGYPLVCRGSETFKADSSKCEGCLNADDAPKYVGFRFIRGSKPSGDGLAPGECSWLDRGVRTDEPDVLVQEIDPVASPEKYNWVRDLHSPDSYWTFNVYSTRGRLLATAAERTGKTVMSDKARTSAGSVEIRSPDLYIAEVSVSRLPTDPAGTARLAVRVGNRGTADARESTLDLRRMKVCKDQLILRSYRQVAVPALRAGQDELVHFDGFDPEGGTYITREGKTASRLQVTVNPSDLYPDCTTVSPVMNYVKTEKEERNNSLAFDPKKAP